MIYVQSTESAMDSRQFESLEKMVQTLFLTDKNFRKELIGTVVESFEKTFDSIGTGDAKKIFFAGLMITKE